MKKIVFRTTRCSFLPGSVVLCLLLSIAAFGQKTPAPTLDEKAVAALLSQLEESLSIQIDDEPLVEQIVDRWESRDDLVGKTRPQVLKLVFSDVQSVINDKEALAAIWKAWTGEKLPDPKLSAMMSTGAMSFLASTFL